MKRIDFENGTVTRNIFSAAIPMLVAQILSLLYNIVDRIYIARIPEVGTTALGAVGLCFPLIVLITAFANLFGSGGAPVFSINRGKKDNQKAQEVMNTSFTMVCGSGIILMIAGMLLARPLLVLFGASEDALVYAYPYMMIYLIGTVPSMIATGMNPFINAQGYATTGMLSVAIGAVANLILDPLFIFVFGFGIKGVAIATVLSRYVEAAIIIIWSHTHTEKMPFAKGLYSTLKVPANLTKKILIKGTPLLLNETLWAAGMAILTQCYSIRGLNVVASQNIANTINNVFNVVFIALGDSVAIVVGQLLGAGNMKKARDTDNKMIAFSVMCCTGVALVMLIVAPFFPKLYNTNLDAQELAKYFIMIMAIFMPQNAFLHASYFTLRSGGKTIITFLFDSVFLWGVIVPIAYFLSRFTGLLLLAVFAMVQVGDILKCIVGFVLVKKGVWMQNIVSGK